MRKNILITGASTGLGEGMAREWAAKGCNLALCARRADKLEALQRELQQAHPDIRVLVRGLDVCDYDQVFEVFRGFRDELGSLDRVVVNAGIGSSQPIGRGHFAANRHTAETNFIAAIAQSEAAMEIFREQNSGHLVLMSSVSGVRWRLSHRLPRREPSSPSSQAATPVLPRLMMRVSLSLIMSTATTPRTASCLL